jgi:hypothetical protein
VNIAFSLKSRLFDLDVAGASADAKSGTAAVDNSIDVMAVETSLHGHRLGDADVSGPGVSIKIEVGAAYRNMNIAAAG